VFGRRQAFRTFKQTPAGLSLRGFVFSRVHTMRTRTFDKLIATIPERRSAAQPCLSRARFGVLPPS